MKKDLPKLRPPQKLFQPEEYDIQMAERDEDRVIFDGQVFVKGFLLKKFKFSQVTSDNVRLSVELQEIFNRYVEHENEREMI